MKMRKAFRFRLNPTKKQARILDQQANECRWLYNELLSQRKLAYEELGIHITKYQQLMFLPELKQDRPSLAQVHSQVVQNVVDRLDKAFQGFFRRVKANEKAGFPRFRKSVDAVWRRRRRHGGRQRAGQIGRSPKASRFSHRMHTRMLGRRHRRLQGTPPAHRRPVRLRPSGTTVRARRATCGWRGVAMQYPLARAGAPEVRFR